MPPCSHASTVKRASSRMEHPLTPSFITATASSPPMESLLLVVRYHISPLMTHSTHLFHLLVRVEFCKRLWSRHPLLVPTSLSPISPIALAHSPSTHNSPGKKFATMAMKIIICKLLDAFDFTPKFSQPVEIIQTSMGAVGRPVKPVFIHYAVKKERKPHLSLPPQQHCNQ